MGSIDILKEIRFDLSHNIDEKYKKNNQRYFKEKINCYGVKTPLVRKIAKKYFPKIKFLEKKEIFNFCEELFKTDYNEETTIAIQWIAGIKNQWEEKDFIELEKLFNYIDNWGKCDDYCLNVLSHFIIKFPKFKLEVKEWSKSKNQWRRRASAVVFIQGKSWKIHKDYLEDVFDIANVLLRDKEDLVQKGYGWMLKIASESYQKEVYEFVMKNKNEMPRTALRYAIEKMPQDMRKEAMKR
ncbi:MAG TPA: DNA alkylation repair protein [Candidatus Nanoarchaeia archaeon]|nr:DNA alkylation repair protein [Candidatus Nanoarchaeia archaeon]